MWLLAVLVTAALATSGSPLDLGEHDLELHGNHPGQEEFRGYLEYFKYSKHRPKCWWPRGCWNFVAGVVHREDSGQGTLRLYKHFDQVEFESGSYMASQPYATFRLGQSTLVGLRPARKGHHRQHMELQTDERTLQLRPRKGYYLVKPGDQTWRDESSGSQTLQAWMFALKTIQAHGSCLHQGTCPLQCVYEPGKRRCTPGAFCRSVQGAEGPQCQPVIGDHASVAAYEQYVNEALAEADAIRDRGCVVRCRNKWDDVMTRLDVLRALKARAQERDNPKLPQFIALVKLRTDEVIMTIGLALAVGLEEAVQNPRSVARLGLQSKGCGDLHAGSLSGPMKLLKDGQRDEARRELEKLQQTCPWVNELMNVSAFDRASKVARGAAIEHHLSPKEEDEAIDEIHANPAVMSEAISEEMAEIADGEGSEGVQDNVNSAGHYTGDSSMLQVSDGRSVFLAFMGIVICGGILSQVLIAAFQAIFLGIAAVFFVVGGVVTTTFLWDYLG
mmetsp:Transcript_8145/g.17732  ORF Transcript_8145/g.17732 Transcript_8145/m.17732 type:complete len:502 (-) Transcript_8145:20-1525(-)|eukprot:CAMPEP_0204419454 /NCGR_PEP_ID=MMETSP0470-20130426/30881_1 /ASSEMBLY_ACC=CAM_ASM_000385 /TAXON_ID=2969 /ORGANISM="Oxyrrhis marina" /LENGTH=501 /DNA_ID=CAMNT_0051416289 /DNA_START=38 /DNA_END=1539 /DNA_ORIENTATION=-